MAVKCSNRTLWTTGDEDGYSYWVEFEDRSFTKGSSKFMYKGRLNGKGPRLGDYCTLKVLKTVDIAKHEDWDLYINRAKKANELAAQFNKMIDNQYKVKFLVPMLGLIDISSTCTDCIYFLSNTKRIRSDDCVAIEPYIGRKFRKFYPNSPLKGAENAYILQAFSHFTASQTGDMLICGLQGVARGTDFYLTNPVIHSANQEWGSKDQGRQGFKDFFAAHTCNSICQSMDLPEYLETTTAPVAAEQRIDDVDATAETTTKNIISDSTDSITQEVAHSDADSLQETKITTLDTSSDIKEPPSILQTPPMTRAGRTIVAPVSTEISVSRSSSVVGPPSFAEDLPGESISRPPAESEILDATPIDDIAAQLSDAQDVVPPPSTEYVGPLPPCSVTDYLELQKNFASFSPGSESIPMIDDEVACAESEMPLPSEDFEPTMSPSLNSYLKDKESLEVIPHGIIDGDIESQPSISVFEDGAAVPIPVPETLVDTPCGTTSQESLVTTPCGTIPQEIDSQPSIVSTPKDEVLPNIIPVSEPALEPELHLDLQQGIESSHDVESEVCLVSIPPDCMDHHLDTLESLEALSPASDKYQSVEVAPEPRDETSGECIEPDAEQVAEEQISAQEVSETQTIQETDTENLETFPTDNVEDEVQKSVCMDSMSSDFKQSLETIPEGSTESDSAHSLENEILAPEASTVVPEATDDVAAVDSSSGTVVENQTVETTAESSGEQGEMMAETTSEIQSGPTPEAAITEETVVEPTSENVAAESATEIQTEGTAVSQETTVEAAAEPVSEATISQETTDVTSAEPAGEAMVSQETAVEASAEPVGETTMSQETSAEPAGEAMMSQETTVETTAEPTGEATMSQETTVEETAGEAMASQETTEGVVEATTSQETTVETSAEPVGEATMPQETTVAQEATVETTAEPVGEATMSQETTVETSAEPVGEATMSQETTVSQEATVETTAEPVGEATMSQETTAECVGEAAMSQETTVETSAEPVGEAAVSQEAAAECVGEAAISQETTVETSAEPVGEAVSQETTVVSAGECYQSQETAEPMAQEITMGEATVSQDTVIEKKEEAINETTGDTNISQDTVVESTSEMPAEGQVGYGSSVETTGEGYINQEATVETTAETNVYQSNGGLASQEVATESTVETTGEGYVCQDTGAGSTAGEACVTQEAAGECSVQQYSGSTVGTSGEGYASQESGFGSTVESAGEGYVCPESAVETTVESDHVGQDIEVGAETVQSTEFESNVETTADGYTSQDSGFGSVVDANPAGYQDQGTSGAYDSDRGSSAYPQSVEPVTSSYPAEADNSQVSDSCYYGVPPEYKISEDCRTSQGEAGCPQTYTKMTIVPDLDTMEYVETKRLDSVCEEHDTQQGIETLPRRRVSYYLEPQESHEIITFRINISPEVTRPDQKPDECTYQNVGTACQCTNSCQTQETSETVGETSGQDSSNFYTYHYTDTSDCMESMPQRSCGYSTDVHQNLPPDWSPTHSICDDELITEIEKANSALLEELPKSLS